MPARLSSDPDRFIRITKGGRYQARPYDQGCRYTIPGTFATKAQARKAIQEFWWGRVKEVPRGTRYYPQRRGPAYAALLIEHGRVRRVLSWHKTREEAASASSSTLPQPSEPNPPWSVWYSTTRNGWLAVVWLWGEKVEVHSGKRGKKGNREPAVFSTRRESTLACKAFAVEQWGVFSQIALHRQVIA